MFCSNCGKEISDNAEFCPNCGNSVNGEKRGNVSNKKLPVVPIICVVILALLALFIKNIFFSGSSSVNFDVKLTREQEIAKFGESAVQYVDDRFSEKSEDSLREEWEEMKREMPEEMDKMRQIEKEINNNEEYKAYRDKIKIYKEFMDRVADSLKGNYSLIKLRNMWLEAQSIQNKLGTDFVSVMGRLR